MSKGTTYAIIIRADQHAAGRYLASCPDIPGWFATGSTADEASLVASEIVRGIVSERRTNGMEAPEVNIQAAQVVVDLAGDGSSPTLGSSGVYSADKEKVTEEDTSSPVLEPVVSTKPESFLEDDEDDKTVFLSSEPMTGRVLKSGK